MEKQLIDIHRPVTICRASAGTGKTYTLAAYYVGLLLSGEDYRSILAITFTNKATAEMSERIMGYLFSISLALFLNMAQRYKKIPTCANKYGLLSQKICIYQKKVVPLQRI